MATALALLACGFAVAWALYEYKRPIPRDQALIRAIKRDDIESCHRLLAQGLDPNTEDAEPESQCTRVDLSYLCYRMAHPSCPESALAVALANYRATVGPKPADPEPIEIVNALLSHHANARAVCATGEPLLCRAASLRYTRCVRALLNHGASLKDRSWNNANVMQEAIYSGRLETVQAIVEAGWTVNWKEIELAKDYGNAPIIAYLIGAEKAK